MEVLEMLDMVKYSLEKAWTISSKRKHQKLEELEQIRQKIMAIDESRMGMVLENSISSKCLPGFGFTNSARKEMEKQLATTLRFLDGQTTSIRSDVSTLGGTVRDLDIADELNDSFSLESESATNTLNTAEYDADGEVEKSTHSIEDLSEGSEDVLVTTSNLESDTGPLGVSITTWRRRKVLEDTSSNECKRANDASSTGETSDDDAYHDAVEEVTVSFGDGLVVRATRAKSVSFFGVKPTVEDNVNRAKELLRNARLMKSDLGIGNGC